MSKLPNDETIELYHANGHKKMPILAVIKKHCKECCVEEPVSTCFAKTCPLFPYRLGRNPFHNRNFSEEAKKQAIKNLKGGK